MRWILPTLLHLITGRVRYFPEFSYSHTSWTHNTFRFFGMIFGEVHGIQRQSSGWYVNGKTYQVGYTLESQIALIETGIRSFLKTFSWKVVLLPTYQLAGMNSSILPYRFAIALDTSGKNSANPGTASFSYTVTGSNPLIAAGILGDTTNTLGAVTYNSVALTKDFTQQYPADRFTYILHLSPASTGANTFAIAGTTFRNTYLSSYSGVVSGAADSANGTDSAIVNPVVSTTVVATGCWLVSFIYGESPVSTTVTPGVIRQVTSTEQIGDSNGTVGTGSQSMTWNNNTAARDTAITIISIAPATGTTTHLLPLTGAGS